MAPLWFLILGAAWHFNRKTPLQQARIAEWKAVSETDKAAAGKAAGKTTADTLS